MTSLITTGQRDRETSIIAFLRQAIPSLGGKPLRAAVPLGIGDDAAVLRLSARTEWAISCDLSIEGTHFLSNYPPESIGYKALARATSDLAALGARSRYFLLALALPTHKTGKWLHRFAGGMSRACREFGMKLIGGDTSRADSVTICVTVVGSVPAGGAISRLGAKPGNLVYVTGVLGAAQLGLEAMLRGLGRNRDLRSAIHAHLYPRIPIGLGQSLARQHIVSSMMDISDGLSTDLARLCAASRVGARVCASQLPVTQIPPALAAKGFNPIDAALHGGEDYGLLFTVPADSAHRLRRLVRTRQITQIGVITGDAKLKLIRADGTQSVLEPKGWQPF